MRKPFKGKSPKKERRGISEGERPTTCTMGATQPLQRDGVGGSKKKAMGLPYGTRNSTQNSKGKVNTKMRGRFSQ